MKKNSLKKQKTTHESLKSNKHRDDVEGRRKLVALLGAGTVVSTQWVSPVIDSVILPAHAQTSVDGPICTQRCQRGNVLDIFRYIYIRHVRCGTNLLNDAPSTDVASFGFMRMNGGGIVVTPITTVAPIIVYSQTIAADGGVIGVYSDGVNQRIIIEYRIDPDGDIRVCAFNDGDAP